MKKNNLLVIGSICLFIGSFLFNTILGGKAWGIFALIMGIAIPIALLVVHGMQSHHQNSK